MGRHPTAHGIPPGLVESSLHVTPRMAAVQHAAFLAAMEAADNGNVSYAAARGCGGPFSGAQYDRVP